MHDSHAAFDLCLRGVSSAAFAHGFEKTVLRCDVWPCCTSSTNTRSRADCADILAGCRVYSLMAGAKHRTSVTTGFRTATKSVSSSGIEPDPRPSQSRVRSGTLRRQFSVTRLFHQYPARESNPVLRFQIPPCAPLTLAGKHAAARTPVGASPGNTWFTDDTARGCLTTKTTIVRYPVGASPGNTWFTDCTARGCLTTKPVSRPGLEPGSEPSEGPVLSTAPSGHQMIVNTTLKGVRGESNPPPQPSQGHVQTTTPRTPSGITNRQHAGRSPSQSVQQPDQDSNPERRGRNSE